MKKDDVNKKNSATWCRINEDGNSERWRKEFIGHFGGEFTEISNLWEWSEPKPVVKIIKKWTITQPDGKKDVITNLSKYCKEHKLDDGAIYRVLNGERNHHKGYRIRRGD